jgi:hypothetical protein
VQPADLWLGGVVWRNSPAGPVKIAARFSWSTRPNEYSTFVRDVFAAGSHSLCANCR